MNNLITVFIDRQHDLFTALIQHLELSVSSLCLAILIAFPLGLFISRKPRMAAVITQLTGIMQTLPSLAILGLMIPVFGIGPIPALVALVIYALFPILQNTVTGINEIDPSLQEAGEALGMNRFVKLKTYEIPLAALIGAGGLGSFILLGIDRHDSSLIIIGAFASALLAIAFSSFLRLAEGRSLRFITVSFLIIAFGTTAAFVQPNMPHNKVIIAGKLGTEPDILINMYKELIEAHSDLKVELKPNFGKTAFLYEAIKSGDIDIYPEFTGTVTTTLLKEKPTPSTNAETVYKQGRDLIYKQDHLVYLEPMAYENTYAVAVPSAFAETHSLKMISDLVRVSDYAVAGFTLEFTDREDGYRGLQSLYGLNLHVKTMEPSLRYEALTNGAITITDAYSTDSELVQYDLVVLQDDKHLFPSYRGAPLIRESVLIDHPELKEILNALSGKITEDEMRTMNYDVRVNGRSAQDVAKHYLQSRGLI